MNMQMPSEERLLRLIRKKKPLSQPDRFGAKPTGADDPEDKTGKQEGKAHSLFEFIVIANKFLIILSCGIVVYIAFIFFERNNYQEPVLFDENDTTEDVANIDSKLNDEQVKLFDYYAGSLNSKNVFQASWEETAIEKGSDNLEVSDLNMSLTLVGIMLDEESVAIIEDKKTKETLFVKEGQKVNGATLDKIQEDRVIFIHNGKTVELVP